MVQIYKSSGNCRFWKKSNSRGKPKEQGTWIHKKLIVIFARWISSEFAVWYYLQIEEILKGEMQISQLAKRTYLISFSAIICSYL